MPCQGHRSSQLVYWEAGTGTPESHLCSRTIECIDRSDETAATCDDPNGVVEDGIRRKVSWNSLHYLSAFHYCSQSGSQKSCNLILQVTKMDGHIVDKQLSDLSIPVTFKHRYICLNSSFGDRVLLGVFCRYCRPGQEAGRPLLKGSCI